MSKILPVIHHLDRQTSLEQAALALRCGADGVFLISHAGEDDPLVPLGREITAMWRDSLTTAGERPFVGVNLLSTSPTTSVAAAAAAGLDGVWIDSPGISSFGVSPSGQKLVAQAAKSPELKVFASVAFKYQPDEHNPAGAAKVVQGLGMIPTTSGPATGIPPALEKVRAMSEAAGGRLAVASGMDVSNARSFAPHLSHILVATGVSEDGHHFNERLLSEFVSQARR